MRGKLGPPHNPLPFATLLNSDWDFSSRNSEYLKKRELFIWKEDQFGRGGGTVPVFEQVVCFEAPSFRRNKVADTTVAQNDLPFLSLPLPFSNVADPVSRVRYVGRCRQEHPFLHFFTPPSPRYSLSLSFFVMYFLLCNFPCACAVGCKQKRGRARRNGSPSC